jgi:hypothetical protein
VLLNRRIAAEGDPREVLEQPADLEVARFLGFTGSLREDDGTTRYVRPAHVSLDPAAALQGTVTRRVHEEDGVLCEITLSRGVVEARSAYPGPAVGEVVGVRIDGGARF